jgi:amidase
LVPVAHGNDGAGSLRQPAAWCGVFGLKPTRGRNPLGPRYGDLASGLVAEHVLTGTVRDSAAVLDATNGPAPGDPYGIEAPTRPYRHDVNEDPPPLRIGVTTTPFIDVEVDPSCVTTTLSAAERCAALGHHVIDAHPVFDGASFERHFLGVWAATTAWMRIDWEERLGRPIEREELEPLAWTLAQHGTDQSAGQHLKNVQELQRVARAVANLYAAIDVLLTPVAAVATLPLASFHRQAGFENARRCMAFTMLANATGQPAMSVPMDPTPDGLPTGAHFMARPGDEATLLQLAGQLERTHPWQHRHPPTPPS